jgi:hypothetical protein
VANVPLRQPGCGFAPIVRDSFGDALRTAAIYRTTGLHNFLIPTNGGGRVYVFLFDDVQNYQDRKEIPGLFQGILDGDSGVHTNVDEPLPIAAKPSNSLLSSRMRVGSGMHMNGQIVANFDKIGEVRGSRRVLQVLLIAEPTF